MSQFIEMVGELRTNTKGWPIKALPELATYSIGLTYKPEDVFEEGIIVLRSGNIQDSKLILDDVVRVKCPIKETLYILEDDILMCSRNGSAALVGKVAQIKEINEPMTYGAFMTVIRSDYSDFLFLYFQSNDFREQVSTGKSSTMNQITQNMLDKISVPFPDEDTRNRLSEILHQADKSEFGGSKSQFIEMFGKTTNRVSLSSLCDTFIDGDWIEAKDQSESGIRLIQTGNVGVGIFKDKGEKARYISEETFNRLNCTEVVEGDILISRLPDPVGRACIIPGGLGKTITAVDCTILRLKDLILPKFFIAFTNTPDYAMQIKKVLSGTTRLRVSRTNLGNIEVPLPSFEEQLRFVSIALQADKSEYVTQGAIVSIDKVNKSYIN